MKKSKAIICTMLFMIVLYAVLVGIVALLGQAGVYIEAILCIGISCNVAMNKFYKWLLKQDKEATL